MDSSNNLMTTPQFVNPFTNLTKLSKIIAIVLGTLYLFGAIFSGAKDYLALVPGHSFYYIWNFFTAGFFERSIFNVIINICAVLLFGKYLEPIWGSKEFLRFILIINASSGFATFILMIFAYYITGNLNLWFNTYICGFSAVLAGFTVAIKQLIPEQEIRLFMAVTVRAKSLPGLLLLINTIFVVIGFPSESFPLTFFGLLFSWIYLRFYQNKPEGVKGDRSDSFSFASFFPDPIQAPIAIISNSGFYLFRWCLPSASNQPEYSMDSNPNDPDTERRRQKALRALDQRMQQIKTTSSTEMPSKEVQEV